MSLSPRNVSESRSNVIRSSSAGVAIRLFDLADQGTVHRRPTSVARGRSGAADRSCTSTGEGGRVPTAYTRRPVRVRREIVIARALLAAGPPYGAFVPSRPRSRLEADDILQLRRRTLDQLATLDRGVAMDRPVDDVAMLAGPRLPPRSSPRRRPRGSAPGARITPGSTRPSPRGAGATAASRSR